MGSGIAQVFAMHNYQVILFDVNQQVLRDAREKITTNLEQLAIKVKISPEEKGAALSKLQFTTSISGCKAGIVIEAIYEDINAKRDLINNLFSVNDNSCIVATNTSSLSVTTLANEISSPERFAGMHFFNPAPLMKLVEVVSTPFSSDAIVQTMCNLARDIEKIPVVCRDSPGFIVNRVARPFYLEALHLVEKHNVPFSTIDRLLEATGFRMGPFKLMDLIGNDVNFAVSNIVYDALNKPERLKPSTIQEQHVREGRLGRKSGKGYYEYRG